MSSSGPPQPLPESLWGDRWRFVSLAATDLEQSLLVRPIPIRTVAAQALPSQQGLPANHPIPGVVIEAGRQSMKLARWLAAQQPLDLRSMDRELSAVVLRTAQPQSEWILATYTDNEVRSAAQTFAVRKENSHGIHFLLVQPDDTGVTYSGLWVLQAPQLL